MKRMLKGLVVISCCMFAGHAPADAQSAARGVLERLIGERADAFVLKEIPKAGKNDVYEISATNGTVYVAGSSGVAISRGAYDYLKETCNVSVSWEGAHVDLPAKFPNVGKRRVECPVQFVHYLNVCTFGYTMVWWDWERWEREIDWMALHGINMPLALNGQELIWRRVWKSYGITDEELGEYFTGPAYLPWHRLGNVNGLAGTLPLSWMEGQATLQKKILARERELGMKPVLQGFAGFAPKALKRVRPKVEMLENSGWCALPATQMINPNDPLFLEVGKKFHEELIKEFGTDHYYLSDSFCEMMPPVGEETKSEDLKAVGRSVYQSLAEVDPDAVWLMMGWPFLADPTFWDEAAIESMFADVPQDKLILLDLAVEAAPVWKTRQSFSDRLWVSSIIQNYGQCGSINGDLRFYASVHAEELNNPAAANRVGIGITPEGIEQNSVVFELQTDAAWSREPIDLDAWMKRYAECRYGSCPPAMAEAWQALLDTFYSVNHTMETVPAFAMDPDLGHEINDGFDKQKVQAAIEKFLACADELGGSDLYRRDLVDFMKAYLMLADRYQITEVREAHLAGDIELRNRLMTEYLEKLDDLDRLMATRPEYHMEQWISDARSWGQTDAEADLYELNARWQVTQWGGNLYNYAWKAWSGIIGGYYRGRWEKKFEAIKAADGQEIDYEALLESVRAWEMNWIRSTTQHRPDLERLSQRREGAESTNNLTNLAALRLERSRREIIKNVSGNEIETVKELFRKYGGWVDQLKLPPGDLGVSYKKTVYVDFPAASEQSKQTRTLIADGWSSDPEQCWQAEGAPQWIGMDLGRPLEISRIQLVTAWGNGSIYRYTISAGLDYDHEKYDVLVDASANTEPASAGGYVHSFDPPVEARLVKVNMLGHNLDDIMRIVELRVFE